MDGRISLAMFDAFAGIFSTALQLAIPVKRSAQRGPHFFLGVSPTRPRAAEKDAATANSSCIGHTD